MREGSACTGAWMEEPESPSPTLTNLNENLGVTQIYHLDANPVDTGLVIIGTQDNGSLMHWRGWGEERHGVIWADGGDNLWRRDEPSVFYATRQLLIMAGGTWDREDESFSVEGISGGFGSDRKCWLCSPVEGDVSGLTATIYLGTYRLWKSEDGGDSWTAISGDLTSGDTMC